MSFTSTGRLGQRTPTAPPGTHTPRGILARLDRIDVWSMPFMFIGIIGMGFLFAFYDVFDINVSFIQSCVGLKPGCTPANAVTALRVPVALNLAGYVIGALLLAPLSDRFGRRNMLLFTMLLTGLGSLYNALAPDYTQFVIARIITGIGVGADLAIVNTYVGEVAPRRNRARWISVIFIMSSLGALLGIWLGLFLTTPPAPWPHGLPFAQASPSFENGWRWMYAVGALLAAIGVVLRLELPESARWLVGQGRLDEADKVVSDMEVVAAKHGPLAPVPDDIPVDRTTPESSLAFRALFSDRVYTRRVIQLLLVWFLGYVTVFSFAAGFTSMLTSLNYPPPEAGLIVAVGAFGFLACALFAVAFAERLERKYWLPFGAVITLIGGVIVAEAGTALGIAFIGSAVVFFGFNVWVPMTYTLSTESFPRDRGLAPPRPFVLVAGVGRLEQNRGRLRPQHHVDDLAHVDVQVVRALVVAPAQMQAGPIRRYVSERLVDRLRVPGRGGHELLVGSVAVHDVASHGQVRRVDLEQEAGGYDRLVFGLHRLADGVQVLVQARVVLVGLEQGDDPGRGCVHERAGHRLALGRAREPGEVGLQRFAVLIPDRAAADRTQVSGAPALACQTVAIARIRVEIGRRGPRHLAHLEPAEPVADVGGIPDLAHLAV